MYTTGPRASFNRGESLSDSNTLIHPFSQQVFTEDLLGIRDTAVNKTGKLPSRMESQSSEGKGESDSNQTRSTR